MRQLPSGTVTFLFTDIEGSTRLLSELGDRYAGVLVEHRRLLREAFGRHAGVEVDTEGDAFFVAFASARSALAAAREAQEALADGRVRVRIGLHTGEAQLVEGTYVGMDVHRAARIAAAGHGGQVVLSDSTRALLDSALELRDLGEHRLKDLTAPERLWQLGDDEFPPLRSLNRTNLPVAASPLIGRARELEELLALVRDGTRIVTITGAGGSGKTRLALQAAAEVVEEFAGGVFFVPLAPLRDSELVLSAIGQAVGAEGDLAEHLRGAPTLLVLDNLEHLLEAAPSVARLLADAPPVKVLVTSRAPIRVSGEYEYALDPLADDEAVALFVARAQAVRRGVVPDESVRTICRRLDRLPLALELGAARIKLLEPAALLERLERRLPLLTAGHRDAPERQRTLRATIDWSYDLLAPEVQHVFRRLSVFAGSFSMEAAEQIADADLDSLAALVDLSLLKSIDGGRFLMLETIREYALERLGQTGEGDELRRRHAAYFVVFAERAEPHLTGAQQAVWLERLERELDNLRAALPECMDAGEPELELRLVGALWRFWATRGDRSEGRRRLEEALARDSSQQLALREKALAGASRLAQFQNDLEAWEAFASERLAINRGLANSPGIAAALTDLAILVGRQGKSENARVLLEESRSISHESGETREEARAVGNLGALAWEQGDYERAIQSFGEAIPLFEIVGDLRGIAVSANGVGRAAVLLQRPHEGLGYLKRSLSLAHSLSDQHEASLALEGLALAALQDGDPERATRLLAQADALRQKVATFSTPQEQSEFEHAVTSARTRLGDAAFDVAWSEGAALTLGEAVAYAREEQASISRQEFDSIGE